MVLKSGSFKLLKTSEAVQAYNGIGLLLLIQALEQNCIIEQDFKVHSVFEIIINPVRINISFSPHAL